MYRIKLSQFEMFNSTDIKMKNTLPCLIIDFSRDLTVMKTHCYDLLTLCRDFKKQIIDGIREDFKDIDSDMNDDYQKSMTIREHLNRKDQFIKDAEELIKTVTSFYDQISSFITLPQNELDAKLNLWNEDYHSYQISYKEIVLEYEGVYGMTTRYYEFDMSK